MENIDNFDTELSRRIEYTHDLTHTEMVDKRKVDSRINASDAVPGAFAVAPDLAEPVVAIKRALGAVIGCVTAAPDVFFNASAIVPLAFAVAPVLADPAAVAPRALGARRDIVTAAGDAVLLSVHLDGSSEGCESNEFHF